MRLLLSRRWFQILAGLLLVLAAGLFACAWHFRVWSWRDLQVYRLMSRECHPVWKDLHWGRVQQGQPVEEVIARTKPVRIDRFGDFVKLSYQDNSEGICFTGVTVIARDGKLVAASAWSCTWHRVFFDSLSAEQWKTYLAALNVYRKASLKAPDHDP